MDLGHSPEATASAEWISFDIRIFSIRRLLTCRSAIESVIAGELRIIEDGGNLTPATEIGTRGVKSVLGRCCRKSRRFGWSLA